MTPQIVLDMAGHLVTGRCPAPLTLEQAAMILRSAKFELSDIADYVREAVSIAEVFHNNPLDAFNVSPYIGSSNFTKPTNESELKCVRF